MDGKRHEIPSQQGEVSEAESADAAQHRTEEHGEDEGHAQCQAASGTSDEPVQRTKKDLIVTKVPKHNEKERARMRAERIRIAEQWFETRMQHALDYIDYILEQKRDLGVGYKASVDILAHNGLISPLAKIPQTSVLLNQQNVTVTPNELKAVSEAIHSMKQMTTELHGTLRPIDQIASSRYVSLSEAVIPEPDRPAVEVEIGTQHTDES